MCDDQTSNGAILMVVVVIVLDGDDVARNEQVGVDGRGEGQGWWTGEGEVTGVYSGWGKEVRGWTCTGFGGIRLRGGRREEWVMEWERSEMRVMMKRRGGEGHDGEEGVRRRGYRRVRSLTC